MRISGWRMERWDGEREVVWQRHWGGGGEAAVASIVVNQDVEVEE
jgi:hypothetical protein